MISDLDRITTGMRAASDATRLSAAYGLEQALIAELEDGRIHWAELVDQFLPVLVAGLGDSHKGVQVHSANCLQFLAYQSEAVIPALLAALRPPDSWRAWGAAIVFARLGLWRTELGPALAAAMGAQDRDVRWAAAHLTLQLGRSYPQAVAMVREATSATSPVIRKMAVYCLGEMGAYADVESTLAKGLRDPERDVRRATIVSLRKLPAISDNVKKQVAALRQDPDPFVQRTADAVARQWNR